MTDRSSLLGQLDSEGPLGPIAIGVGSINAMTCSELQSVAVLYVGTGGTNILSPQTVTFTSVLLQPRTTYDTRMFKAFLAKCYLRRHCGCSIGRITSSEQGIKIGIRRATSCVDWEKTIFMTRYMFENGWPKFCVY